MVLVVDFGLDQQNLRRFGVDVVIVLYAALFEVDIVVSDSIVEIEFYFELSDVACGESGV